MKSGLLRKIVMPVFALKFEGDDVDAINKALVEIGEKPVFRGFDPETGTAKSLWLGSVQCDVGHWLIRNKDGSWQSMSDFQINAAFERWGAVQGSDHDGDK